MRFGTRMRTAGMLGLGLAGGAVAMAVGSVPDSGGVIHACYEVQSGHPADRPGNVRIIDPSASQTCSTSGTDTLGYNEVPVSWNQSGPTGGVGATGAAGTDGATGAAGTDGATGPTGAAGATGAKGDAGPQGGQGTAGDPGAPGTQGAPGAIVANAIGVVTFKNGPTQALIGVDFDSNGSSAKRAAVRAAPRSGVPFLNVVAASGDATPTLAALAASPSPAGLPSFPAATLTIYEAGHHTALLTFDLTRVFIGSFKTSSGASGLTDTYVLAADRVKETAAGGASKTFSSTRRG